MSYNYPPDLSTRYVWNLALRHKKKIVLMPMLFVALGAAFFLFCPRTYRSEARLFLRIGRETVGIDPTATAGQTLPFTADRMDEVKSAQEIFKSRSVAANVVDRVGADVVLGKRPVAGAPEPKSQRTINPLGLLVYLMKGVDPVSAREEAIIQVERSLTVAGERQSTVIVVRYDADSPQLAETLCRTVVEVAQQEYIRVHRSEESRPFFLEQQERLREQLDKSLEALRNAKDEMGLADVGQRRETLEAQYNAIELDRLTSNQQLATAQARIEDLQRQLAEIPERLIASKKSMPNIGADILRDRFYALQVQSMDLEARYQESHPYVRAARAQLDDAQRVIAEQAEQRLETTDEINPIHRDLSLAMKQEHAVVAGLESRIVELNRQREDVLADLRTVNEHDLRIDKLARNADLARAKFMQYAQTLEEARIDRELQKEGVSNISVAQAATLAEKPVFPSRSLTVAGTFLLAMFGTLGLVLISERDNAPAPQVGRTRVAERRIQRRRARREFTSKANGHAHAELEEVPNSPK